MNDPIEIFIYWMNERQQIYLNRKRGLPKPWTNDVILQKYKFTNVFREQDKTTIDLRNRIKKRDSQLTIFWKIFIFRMFNWTPTYDALAEQDLHLAWRCRTARKILNARAKKGKKIFTGAYIITNSGSKRSKIDCVTAAIDYVWPNRKDIMKKIATSKSIEKATKILTELPMIGPFVAYELATDLRHTTILNDATDIYTWANPGPGARRGCNRIYRGDPKEGTNTEEYINEMNTILSFARVHVNPRIFYGKTRNLEMRDIEHSLCEFDKYMRVSNGEGRPRSRYDGV